MDFYILVDHEPVLEPDPLKWAMWMHDNKRVAEDYIAGMHISTIYLGFDAGIFPDHQPLLFETMVFSADGKSLYQGRCSTWNQAQAMHLEAKTMAAKYHSAIAN